LKFALKNAQKQLLDETVKAYDDSVKLASELAQAGIYSDEDLVQAETQLETTQAQDTTWAFCARQYEHCDRVAHGKPAAEFSLRFRALA